MIGWILIGLLTVTLAYLLLAPFSVRLDSREAAATVKLFHLGSGRVCYRDEGLWLELRVLGMRFEWDAISLAAKMAAREERKALKREQKRERLEAHTPEAAKKPRQSNKHGVPIRRLWAVLRSFEMPECTILIDTGSPAHNGMLYPLGWWAGRWSGKNIGITFQGYSVCVLEVQNTLGRMLWAFIRGK